MLSTLQQKAVWEGWLSAEIRANYFGELCHSYQHRQRVITWLTLAFSSGAFATLVADWLPAQFGWVRAVLALAAAALSLWSLVAQNQKNSTDCSDLHFRWNKLAGEFESLWDQMHDADAPKRLAILRERNAELSKSSAALPVQEDLMEKWQTHTMMHHKAAA